MATGAPNDRPQASGAGGDGRSVWRRLTVLLVVALVFAGWATGRGAYALFTATTESSNSTLATGTVVLSDDDAGGAVVSLVAAQPGDSSTGCIDVTYTGSLDAGMRLYADQAGTLGTYVTLTITRGVLAAPSFNSCGSFTPDAQDYVGAGPGVLYSGLLSAYPTNWSTGLVDPIPASPETWQPGEDHAYQIRVALGNDPSAQGLTAAVTFTWEARNP